jgi:hypothetical protein
MPKNIWGQSQRNVMKIKNSNKFIDSILTGNVISESHYQIMPQDNMKMSDNI